MSHALDELNEHGGSLHHLAMLLKVDYGTAYKYLSGDRPPHYDLEHALTQAVGLAPAKRILALINGTNVDEREIWLEPKRCTGCGHLDFFPIHHESPSGRSLYLECNACGKILQYWRQAKRRAPRRPDIDTTDLVAAYNAPAPISQVARDFGMSRDSVRRRLVLAGVEIRRDTSAPPDPEEREKYRREWNEKRNERRQQLAPKVLELLHLGHTLTTIAQSVGLSRNTITKIIREQAAA